MKKDEFAKELIMGELKKERGKFVTLRIIDRLVLLYAPLFDREFLAAIAEKINQEGREERPSNSSKKDPAEGGLLDDVKNGAAGRRLAAAFNH